MNGMIVSDTLDLGEIEHGRKEKTVAQMTPSLSFDGSICDRFRVQDPKTSGELEIDRSGFGSGACFRWQTADFSSGIAFLFHRYVSGKDW